jgi:DNA-binding NarL/FixJ family response regulator
MTRTRVLIADDHRILAEGLRGLLETEFEVVGIVENGQEMIAAAEKLLPDVIVADISMPGCSGIQAAARLHELGIVSRVVILTQNSEVAYARQAMETGALGYVLKSAASSELITAIREAIQGRTFVTPVIAGQLIQTQLKRETQNQSERRLTSRQLEVLKLVVDGYSAKQIASALGISVRTAEAHKANILQALDLSSTAELVQYAIRESIISI